MISRSHHFWPTDPFRLPCQPAPTAREPDEVRDSTTVSASDSRCKMAMAMASFAVASHHRVGHLAAGFPSTAREGGRVGRVTIAMRAQVDAQLC